MRNYVRKMENGKRENGKWNKGKCYKLSAAANIALNCRKSAQMGKENHCRCKEKQ